jgi:1-aminocyclopropane-1-carboxylate deaminase/D-cysteine desulfhydrase-like pyridoxal-dependent ACC family enzyme
VDETEASLQRIVADLTRCCGQVLKSEFKLEPEEIRVSDDYSKAGYAVMTEREREAIEMFARKEAILLDPVYTGRAAAGLIDMCRTGKIAPGERILFWHTGGAPALFSYAAELSG